MSKRLLSIILMSLAAITYLNAGTAHAGPLGLEKDLSKNNYNEDRMQNYACNGSPDNTIESIMKDYRNADIRIAYCNHGGYVVKNLVFKIEGFDSNGSKSSELEIRGKKLDLHAGEGSYALVDHDYLGGKIKVKIQYNIASGDKKSCSATFTTLNQQINYFKHSKGTTLNNNGCRGWSINNTW